MYGDIAHGSILFLLDISSFFRKKNHKNSRDFNNLNSAKYLITLMGFFSVYSGFIYNDFMSLPLNFFGSCWEGGENPTQKCTYIFGVDPVWKSSNNQLTFYNSLKMKMAVVLGVS